MMPFDKEVRQAYAEGYADGTGVGLGERVALATANGELRSDIREMRAQIIILHRRLQDSGR